MEAKEPDFNVNIIAERADKDTLIVTSPQEKIDTITSEALVAALEKYDANKMQYSAYSTSSDTAQALTSELIDQLSESVYTSLDSVLQLNAIIRKHIITDDIIGKTYESIESNVNTDFRLSYVNVDGKKQQNQLKRAKEIIDNFNEQVNLKSIIRQSIPLTYAEGTRIFYLRSDGGNYIIDNYPLGVAFIGEYTINGRPVVCIDIRKLEASLKKTYSKDKKNKPIFFKNIEDDIKNNYPPEVYDAWKRKETQVRLDYTRVGIMRIGNLGRQYGVSPISRALKSALMLSNYENTDAINSSARAKKIIHQVLRKELLGSEGKFKGHSEMAFAHDQLMQAWKNKTVVISSPAYVEKIVYVEPKVEDTSTDKISLYRSKEMTSLGIGFSDANNASFATVNISLDQLMRTINMVGEQLEDVMKFFYGFILADAGIDAMFVPEIKIIDSEALDFGMRKDLGQFLYGTLNCSLDTVLHMFGISMEDELAKRVKENNENYDDIFYPRSTSYTSSGSPGVNKVNPGRPATSKDKAKQAIDEARNGTKE